MRTIKFRGKSRFGIHEWLYGSLLLLNGKAYICPDKAAVWNMTRYEVILNTTGQFTGLLDKDGKEIYEGDILHTITFGFNPEEYTAIILYRNCSFQLSNGRNLFYFGQSDLTKMDDTIVIDNIYDNPELIKEE